MNYRKEALIMIHTKGLKRLSVDQICTFLRKVDKMFPKALSEKTDPDEYALKLYKNATLCTVEDDGEIVSMVAGYTENTVGAAAYISMAATLPQYRGEGLSGGACREH